LYAEEIPNGEGEPARYAYYPTAGLTLVYTCTGNAPVRGLYAASNGKLFAASGTRLIELVPNGSGSFTETGLATLFTSANPVSMIDNSLTLMVVDGSTVGYAVDLPTSTPTSLSSATVGFYAADRVDYLDTYFVLNQTGTPQMFVSNSLSTTFGVLDFANKSSASDLLTAVVAIRGELWLIGRNTSEVWTDSGATDFPFQKLAGVLVEHGCTAVYSIAKTDGSVFFLSNDLQGKGIVLRASGYSAARISTSAIEASIAGYAVTDDARGFCYQQFGHTFYVLTFPTANATWVYDESSAHWHQWERASANGSHDCHVASCFAQYKGLALVGDSRNGNIYKLDPTVDTENTLPISRNRSFPHSVAEGRRVTYRQFSADVECGATGGATPTISLSWSDDRGRTFGTPIVQNMAVGAVPTLTQPKWSRLGSARDRVWDLSWTAPTKTTLLGAFLDAEPCET